MKDKYYAKFIEDEPSMKENPDLDKMVTIDGATQEELNDMAKEWKDIKQVECNFNEKDTLELIRMLNSGQLDRGPLMTYPSGMTMKSSSPSPLKIKVKSINGGKIPSKAKAGDAAIDLYCNRIAFINPGERTLVCTGICMEIPDGYFGLILGRSGNASKKGICILGGVIDSGYRGEINVVMLNTGEEQQKFYTDDRIAQMVFLPVPTIEIEAVEELDSSERGSSGFGSTGN